MCSSEMETHRELSEPATQHCASTKEAALKIPIDNTTILDCLDIMKHEYEIERNKRQSFETRSGLVITILAALCIFIFDRVSISDIFELMKGPCTFIVLIKILSGVAIYISFILSLYFVIKTINVKTYKNLNVSAIDECFMGKPRIEGALELVQAYRDIITQHRNINQTSANDLKASIYCVAAAVSTIIIYVNL